jgi:hypothetical protein
LLLWLNRDSPCFGNSPDARRSFHTACMHASVHALRCAEYETRTTNCVPHMRLTILNPSHAKQCRAAMPLLQRFVRRSLGWHLAFYTAQVCCPLPHSQRTRCFTEYTDAFGFTHQRRPYGRSSSRATTDPTFPLPSRNPFAALPLDDCVDTDTETSGTDETDSPVISGAARDSPSRQSPRAAGAPPHDTAPHAPRPPPATCLGTWNVHNLNSKDSLSRLVALSHFMHYHGMGVLAVQETRLPPQTPLAAETGLLYFGSSLTHQPPLLPGHRLPGSLRPSRELHLPWHPQPSDRRLWRCLGPLARTLADPAALSGICVRPRHWCAATQRALT